MNVLLDDVLESFLSEYREKRHHRQQKSAKEAVVVAGGGADPFDSIDHSYSVASSTSTTTTDTVNTNWAPAATNQQRDDSTSRDMEDSLDDDEEPDEGEECYFTTPEHPEGVELVLNLLSTWGDKFYIGLTGIEVYTSTGQPATIAQVGTCKACLNC